MDEDDGLTDSLEACGCCRSYEAAREITRLREFEAASIEKQMPAHHVERLDTLAKAAGITRAQAVSMLLLDKGESE